MQNMRGEVHAGFGCGNLRERGLLKDRGVDGRILLKWIFKKQDGRAWTGFIWKRAGTVAGCCEHGNELPSSITCSEFLTS
jgi:hypothetical protein